MRKKVVFWTRPILFIIIAALTLSTGEPTRSQSSLNLYLPIITAPGDPITPPASEPVPIDLVKIVRENVEAGVWTKSEGIIQILSFIADESADNSWLPAKYIPQIKLSGLIRSARAQLNIESNPIIKDEMERVLSLVSPDKTNIDHFSIPYTDAQQMLLSNAMDKATREQCTEIWRSGFDLSLAGGAPCYARRTIGQKTAAGGDPIVAVYQPIFADIPSSQDLYHEAATNALQKSVETYKPLGNMPDIDIVWGPYLQLDGTLADARPNGKKCLVTVYQNSYSQSLAQFQQTIAHEVFHCYQFENLEDEVFEPEDDASDWWVEGTAEYFSNVVYPNTNDEYHWDAQFANSIGDTSLVDMSYETNKFFQFLGNKLGNEKIIDILKTMPTTGGRQEQLIALSQVPNIDNLFLEFAQQFAEKKIVDSSGQLYDPKQLSLSAISKTVDSNNGFSVSQTLKPFTITVLQIKYKSKNSFDQTLDLKHVRMAHLYKLTGVAWSEMFESKVTACLGENTKSYVFTTTKLPSTIDQTPSLSLSISKGTPHSCSCYFEAHINGHIYKHDIVSFYDNGSVPLPIEITSGDLISTIFAFRLDIPAIQTYPGLPIQALTFGDAQQGGFTAAFDPASHSGEIYTNWKPATGSTHDHLEGTVKGTMLVQHFDGTVEDNVPFFAAFTARRALEKHLCHQ